MAVIVAIGALTFTSGVAAAATHVVNQTSPACTAGNYYYTSIQAAVWNATDGDTIIVCPGRYNEIVNVNRSNIVIKAFNETKPVISVNGASYHVFNISDQRNVTLEGFEIQDANGTDKQVAGIYMFNASACNIINNSVTNISATSFYVAHGVYLRSSNNNTFCGHLNVSYILANDDAFGVDLVDSNNNTFNANISISNISANKTAYGLLLDPSPSNFFYSVFVQNVKGDNAAAVYISYSLDNTFNRITVTNANGKNAAYCNVLDHAHNTNINELNVNGAYSKSGYPCGLYAQYSDGIGIGFLGVQNVVCDGAGTSVGVEFYLPSNCKINKMAISNVLNTGSGIAKGVFDSYGSHNTLGEVVVNGVSSPNSEAYGVKFVGTNYNTVGSLEIYGINGNTVTGFKGENNKNCLVDRAIFCDYNGRTCKGISSDPSDNVTFNNTLVSNITASGENSSACGIYLLSATNHTFRGRTNVSFVTATDDAYGIVLNTSDNNSFDSGPTIIDTVTSVNGTAYGIYLLNNTDNNNFSAITIRPTLTGGKGHYEFWSEEGCDDNVVTDLTIGNPTTISFTYGDGVSIKRVEAAERPTDPPGYKNIGKYINASNPSPDSWLSVNFSYSQVEVTGVDEGTLKVWKYNGTWYEAGWNGSRVLATTNNVVGVNITSFSIFAPLGKHQQCLGTCCNNSECTVPYATDMPCNECINQSKYWKPNKDSACFAGSTPSDLCLSSCPQCCDGKDNEDQDPDGDIDFPADNECTCGLDPSEVEKLPPIPELPTIVFFSLGLLALIAYMLRKRT